MRIVRSLFILSLATSLSGCWSGIYENPGAQYVNRSDTITLSAGNAKDVNAATQVIDPWPPGVGDRRIPANGERMGGAVERYQRPQTQRSQQPPGQGGQPISPTDATGGTGGSSGAAVPSATLRY